MMQKQRRAQYFSPHEKTHIAYIFECRKTTQSTVIYLWA